MATYWTTLYDTAIFTNGTPPIELILFKVGRGGDATHNEQFTNNPAGGSLPAQEQFEVKKISVVIDHVIAIADIKKWFVGSFLDFRLNDRTVFQAPLALLVDGTAFGGSDSTTAGAAQNNVGLLGDGYELPPDKIIILLGGKSFYVRVIQGTALAAATQNVKVILQGLHTIPD